MVDGRNPWRVIVVGSSHNDIGWAGTPSEIAEHREHKIIDGVLDLFARDAHYAYAVEASLYADEYLERNPQRADFVRDLVDSGRLEWGGTYVQPYEGLYSGEALFRQVEYGRRSIEKRWGIRSRSAWNVDVQGRARNLAQIYKPAGIDYLIVSRCRPGLYWWEAQDGSRLLVLSLMQGHYGYPFLNSRELHSSPLETEPDGDGGFQIEGAAAKLKELTETFEPFFAEHGLPRTILVCVTADYTVPSGALSRLIENWNDNADTIARDLGIDATLEYGTAQSYIGTLEESGALESLPVIRGEMPNPWLYIHGPGHHKTVDAMRRGQAALLTAEQLQAVLNPAGLGDDARERTELDNAWREHLYIDHGFGGLHGLGTDEIFRYKAESALHTANVSIEESLTRIAADAGLNSEQVLVYNPLSVPRSDWVEVEIELTEPLVGPTVEFQTADGRTVEGRVLSNQNPSGVRSGIARIGFVAPDVPALSSIVLTRLPQTGDDGSNGVEPFMQERVGTSNGDIGWSNEFYSVSVSRGGIAILTDNANGIRVADSKRYLLGETIALDSPGIDVGQHEHDSSWDYTATGPYQPALTRFERTGNRGTDPQIEFQSDAVVRVSSEAELAGATVKNTYTFYRDLSSFDVRIDVIGWSGEHGRELRVCFPFAGNSARVSYEVPAGDVVVGEDEIEGSSQLRPREVQSWIQAVDGDRALTLSGSVAVYDWLDVEGSGSTVLQGILLATKRSCHIQGNWYEQAGDHTAHFRVDPTGARASDRTSFGHGFATPLRARRGTAVGAAGADIPAEVPSIALPSWLVPDASNVKITSIKPVDGGLLIRYWEHEGSPASIDLSNRAAGVTVSTSDPFGDDREPLDSERLEIQPHAHRTIVIHAPSNTGE